MSRIHLKPIAPPRNWLICLALWGVVLAWGALGVWGWLHAATGAAAFILVALAICGQVIGARMACAAAQAPNWGRGVVCILLGLGCVAFTALSGERALAFAEAERLAPYQAAKARHDTAANALAMVKAQLPAPVALSLDAPASRVERLTALRNAEIERLGPALARAEAALEAAPSPPAPAPALPDWARWAMAVLIEALEAMGFWAIGAGRKERPTRNGSADIAPLDPSELGRRLVGMRKDRKAA